MTQASANKPEEKQSAVFAKRIRCKRTRNPSQVSQQVENSSMTNDVSTQSIKKKIIRWRGRTTITTIQKRHVEELTLFNQTNSVNDSTMSYSGRVKIACNTDKNSKMEFLDDHFKGGREKNHSSNRALNKVNCKERNFN